MAWVTPSTRTAGTLITAAIWNQDVVSNPILLKTSITTIGGLTYSTILTTTSTAADYAHAIDTDVVIVTAGDVRVVLATATASSTGRFIQVKNRGTGVVTVNSSAVAIDGSTANKSIASSESMMFVRWRSTDWIVV